MRLYGQLGTVVEYGSGLECIYGEIDLDPRGMRRLFPCPISTRRREMAPSTRVRVHGGRFEGQLGTVEEKGLGLECL